LSDNNELNNDEDNAIANSLAKFMKFSSGKINVRINNKPTLSLDFQRKTKRVLMDVKDASIFGMSDPSDDNLGLFEKLKAAKIIAQIFDENDITFSILRKGKKAISLGKEANPKLSRVITGSDDIQIDSIRQTAKLGRDIQKSQ